MVWAKTKFFGYWPRANIPGFKVLNKYKIIKLNFIFSFNKRRLSFAIHWFYKQGRMPRAAKSGRTSGESQNRPTREADETGGGWKVKEQRIVWRNECYN